MTIPPPTNYTLNITSPEYGTQDLAVNFAYSGGTGLNQITQNFGRQGDSAALILMDEHGDTGLNFVIPSLSTIELIDNDIGRVIFAGVVADPLLRWQSPNLTEWNLNCIDFTTYPAFAIVQGTYLNWAVDDIVLDLVKQANCGITATKVASGGYVYPGPVLSRFIVTPTTLQTALQNLAAQASTVASYGWRVDHLRNLWFYNEAQAPNSGVTLTDRVTGDPTPYLGFIEVNTMFQYEWDGSSINTRVIVQGSTITVKAVPFETEPTDVWVSNGALTSWPLSRDLDSGHSSTIVLTVNGVTKSVSIDSGNGYTTDYGLRQNVNGQWFLEVKGATSPSRGSSMKLWYDYTMPVLAQADDTVSQQAIGGPNGGVFAAYINDASLTTINQAFERAQSEVREFSKVVERVQFYTAEGWPGHLRAGDIFRFQNALVPDATRGYALGVDDTYLVISATISITQNGYRQYWITAERTRT